MDISSIMIKMRTSDGDLDQARAANDYILEKGRAILASAPRINDADRSLLASSIEKQEADFELLERIVTHVDDPRVANAIYEIITKLMLASFVVGTAGTMSPEADDWRRCVLRSLKATNTDNPRMQKARSLIEPTAAFRADPNVSAEAIFEEVKGEPDMSLSTVKRRLAEIRKAQA